MATTPVSELPKIPSEIAEAVTTHAVELKHCETAEKNVLPSKEDIVAEKTHQELTSGIEQFKGDSLNHVNPDVKNVLPSAEDIAREKTLVGVADFDATKLKHVEPTVKTSPIIDE